MRPTLWIELLRKLVLLHVAQQVMLLQAIHAEPVEVGTVCCLVKLKGWGSHMPSVWSSLPNVGVLNNDDIKNHILSGSQGDLRVRCGVQRSLLRQAAASFSRGVYWRYVSTKSW